MKNQDGMAAQLVIELGEDLARAFDTKFGDGAFEEWLARMRDGGFMAEAWDGDEPPPPIFFLLSGEVADRLMTDEERDVADRVGLDEDGVARGRYCVRVLAVDTGEDIRMRLDVALTAVPGTWGART